MSILNYLKNNRIKLLKYLITIVVLFFLLCIIYEIFKVLFDDVYNTITLTYILLIIIINFIPEFSPYILNNYLIYLFPFLSNYLGRGIVYIIIGLATIPPELNNLLNYGGYALIITGLLCLYMNWLLSKKFKAGYTNLDFKNVEKKEYLNYHNEENNSGRNSTNSDTNDKNEKNGTIENNMMKFQEALNNQEEKKVEDEEKKVEENNKKVEMKDLEN